MNLLTWSYRVRVAFSVRRYQDFLPCLSQMQAAVMCMAQLVFLIVSESQFWKGLYLPASKNQILSTDHSGISSCLHTAQQMA